MKRLFASSVTVLVLWVSANVEADVSLEGDQSRAVALQCDQIAARLEHVIANAPHLIGDDKELAAIQVGITVREAIRFSEIASKCNSSTSQTVLVVAMYKLSPEDYMTFLTECLEATKTGTVEPDTLLVAMYPQAYRLMGILEYNYRHPRVVRFLREAARVFANHPSLKHLVSDIRKIESGEAASRVDDVRKFEGRRDSPKPLLQAEGQ